MKSVPIEIEVTEDGPYRVMGTPLARMRRVFDDHAHPVEWKRGDAIEVDEEYWLCRCGHSSNKPFCDGTHARIDFDGTEHADSTPTAERRKAYHGEGIVVTDDEYLCEHAGFCVADDTSVWKLVEHTADPAARDRLVRMINNCPSGRLRYHLPPDPTPVEENFAPEIAVVDDGPLWVRGRVPVASARGFTYEVRNRVTLCRCGASKIKPFCDGTHTEVEFRDS